MATHCDRAPKREASSEAWELRAELGNGCMPESKLLGNSCGGQAQISTEATCEHMQKRSRAGPEQVWAAVRRHALVQGDSSNHPASWEGANLAQSEGRIQQGQRGQAISRGGNIASRGTTASEWMHLLHLLAMSIFCYQDSLAPKTWCPPVRMETCGNGQIP